jgi:hypothetical protein
MWYNLTPSEYAVTLHWYAARSDEGADAQDKLDVSWGPRTAERLRHQARRLRAMAMLCERSVLSQAGDVDFHDLHSPALTREQEVAIIEEIEALPTAPVAASAPRAMPQQLELI